MDSVRRFRTESTPMRALDGEQPIEKRTVALQGDSEVLGRDVVTARPLVLQIGALPGEEVGQSLHALRDQCVGLLDGIARIVHESRLDLLPASRKVSVSSAAKSGVGECSDSLGLCAGRVSIAVSPAGVDRADARSAVDSTDLAPDSSAVPLARSSASVTIAPPRY